jgi:multidrug efflux system membrane fusion protein
MKIKAVHLALPLALLAGCASSAEKAKTGKSARKLEYPVEVQKLDKMQVHYTVTAPGSIEAFQQVQITSRVAGAVDAVSFKEGQAVKKDQVLVTIEQDRFQVAVDQAKAALAKTEANEQGAEGELGRRTGADQAHPGLIPGEEIATYSTQVATAKADVESSKQALRVATLNLRDSSVRAPIAGVVQTRTVQVGQYLNTGTVLATILQRDPLLLRFQVSEQDAPRLKSGMTANLKLAESVHAYVATITLVADAADPTTRLVPVTAEIDDATHNYWLRPGAFCDVDVPIGDARAAIVVPTLAVQPTENGNNVYVVENNVAKVRAITLGMHTPDGTVEVTHGLNAGDQLVVRGIDLLSDGAPVKITKSGTGAPAGSGAAPPGSAAPPADSGALPASAAPPPVDSASAANAPAHGKHKKPVGDAP